MESDVNCHRGGGGRYRYIRMLIGILATAHNFKWCGIVYSNCKYEFTFSSFYQKIATGNIVIISAKRHPQLNKDFHSRVPAALSRSPSI